MANPRQRRKARSSSHRPVKQSRRANKLLKKQPPIKGPKVLQDAWDKRKTIRQNYAALGLAHTLCPTGSGVQDHSRGNAEVRLEGNKLALAEGTYGTGNESVNVFHDPSKGDRPPRGFGRIIRDESGAVVDVVLAEEETPDSEQSAKDKELDDFPIENSSGPPENMVHASVSGWLLENCGQGEPERKSAKEVLEALRVVASAAETKKGRTSSSGEIRYLIRLVERYGNDYDAMSRDRKLNANQYSAGQLKRAIGRTKVIEQGGR